jgi:hypothetical protein
MRKFIGEERGEEKRGKHKAGKPTRGKADGDSVT